MGKTVTTLATYEDLLKVLDHLVAEIVDGELITRGTRFHTSASDRSPEVHA